MSISCLSRISDRPKLAVWIHYISDQGSWFSSSTICKRNLLMVRFELNKTLQLHLSRSTLQTDYINFTTKSKIISYIYHKRHQALCISAVVLLLQLFCLFLLHKLYFSAPGDTRKTQIHVTFIVYIIAQRQRKICWEKSGKSPAILFCSSSTSVISWTQSHDPHWARTKWVWQSELPKHWNDPWLK